MDSRVAYHRKIDNYYFLSYNCRILDAFASIFHVSTNCAATFVYKDILYISYNSQIRPNEIEARNSIELIYQVISRGLNREALTLYLLLNKDFIKFIRHQHSHESKVPKNEDFKNQLAFFKERYEELKAKLVTNIRRAETIDESCMEIRDAYFGIINSLKQYDTLLRSKKKKDIEIKEQILRPVQDVEKVLYSMKNGYSIAVAA